MRSHTPTPWKHVSVKGGWDGVADADGSIVCNLSLNVPENASHIVKCVNAHDDLVEAANAAIAYDAAIQARAADNAETGSWVESDTLDVLYLDWHTKARAALAKATS